MGSLEILTKAHIAPGKIFSNASVNLMQAITYCEDYSAICEQAHENT